MPKISTKTNTVVLLGGIGLLWCALIFLGERILLNYEFAPAVLAAAPAKWPEQSKIQRASGRASGLPMIVVWAHPHCPCSRATIGELARLMATVHGRAVATVLFVRPKGVTEDWEKTDLWRSAAAIPSVTVKADNDGVEASLFGAQASGQTMLYSADGVLEFSGGITSSRGHEGDNVGRSSIASLITTGSAATSRTSVFGCSLHDPERATQR